MSELYTIDKTPSTELEKFQALRIEALMKHNEYLQSKLNEAKDLLNGVVDYASQIEVESETIEP